MPGFTHLQNAQPVLFSHYLLSFFEMLERDKLRINQLYNNMNTCPLGSGALVGSNFFEIDRFFLAKELGFDKPTENSIDSVSDRDCSRIYFNFSDNKYSFLKDGRGFYYMG